MRAETPNSGERSMDGSNPPISMLYLEDDSSDVALLKRELEKSQINAHIFQARNELEFIDALKAKTFHIILADYRIPGFGGKEALEARIKWVPDIPFIFLSGHIGEDLVVECLRAGATDYVLKHRLNRLEPVLRRALAESEEKKKSIHLREQLEKLANFSRHVIESSLDMIIAVDLDQKITLFNPAAEHCFGYTASEIMNKPVEILYADKSQSMKIRAKAEAQGGCIEEVLNRRKDGSTFSSLVSGSVLRDESGSQIGFMGISRDITEQKTNEARWIRSQRMEAIGTLTSGVAHDLNNVLAPIAMSATLLKMTDRDTNNFQNIVEIIEGNCQRATDIIGQLLSFSRGVEGKRVVMNPVHGIKQIIKMAKQTFPKNITWSVATAKDLWLIRSDPTQFEQVILNLCVNARDALPNGGVISISAENFIVDDVFRRMDPEAVPGNYVLIKVTDTGIGIPREILHKIFEPFFTTKAQGKGTGLGLSTVLGILKSHGGLVDVSSTVGHGTTFKIYFPAEITAKETLNSEGHAMPLGHGETILIVDDEEAIRLTTALALRDFGYKVQTATDGRDALSQLLNAATKIDLVLMDLMMPSMDGFTLLEMMNRLKLKVPVIASSGLQSATQLKRSIATLESIGVHAFLQKPYNAEKLLKKIEECLMAKHSI